MVNSIKITDYITEDLIDLDLKSKNREGILIELSELLEKSPNVTGEEKDIYKALVDREKLGSTGIGKGVAIPHAKTESATGLTVAFGVSKEGIDFNSLDEEEVHLFFVFASPNKDSQVYLKVVINDEKYKIDYVKKAILVLENYINFNLDININAQKILWGALLW